MCLVLLVGLLAYTDHTSLLLLVLNGISDVVEMRWAQNNLHPIQFRPTLSPGITLLQHQGRFFAFIRSAGSLISGADIKSPDRYLLFSTEIGHQ